MFVGSILSFCGGSSPEAKLMELAPKFQKVMCSKNKKVNKEAVSKAMQTLIETTPQSIKDAVI